MLSSTLQSSTFLIVNLIVHGPTVMSQGLDLASLNLASLPQCAMTCSMSALASIGEACALTDVACFCKNQDFMTSTKACLIATCAPEALAQLGGGATKICAAAGVTIPSFVTVNPKLSLPVPTTTAPTTAATGQATSNVVTPAVSSITAVPASPAALVTSASVTSTPIVPSPVATPSAHTTTIDNPTGIKNSTSEKTSSSSTPAQQNDSSADTSESTNSESSGSTSTKAISLLVIGTTVATLLVL